MSKNILFFSQNCNYSKKLIAKIINTPIYNSLQKVSVDDPQTRARLPKWVTCVPLIYFEQPQPGYSSILKEQELWKWVEEQISRIQMQNQPPQQQFQQQNHQQNQQQNQQMSQINQMQQQQQQYSQQSLQPMQSMQTQNKQSQQPSQQQQQSLINQNSMGFEPFNGMEMKGGIASDNYSLFTMDNGANSSNLFPHTYETVGGGPSGGPQFNNNHMGPPQPSNMQGGGGSQESSNRSSQKQDKFDQDLAMKKALRDQDLGMSTGPAKMDGVPQNFNQMWEQNNNRKF
jgi:hypothetical protein